ncbi:hypothetical protein ACHAWF_010015 [Thalassiosira exigua]
MSSFRSWRRGPLLSSPSAGAAGGGGGAIATATRGVGLGGLLVVRGRRRGAPHSPPRRRRKITTWALGCGGRGSVWTTTSPPVERAWEGGVRGLSALLLLTDRFSAALAVDQFTEPVAVPLWTSRRALSPRLTEGLTSNSNLYCLSIGALPVDLKRVCIGIQIRRHVYLSPRTEVDLVPCGAERLRALHPVLDETPSEA